jgi:DNA-binding CsgD family transcriptional regulator
MPSSSHLHEGDVDLMLALLDEARTDEIDHGMPWIILGGLLRLIRCDLGVTYSELDVANDRTPFHQEAQADDYREVWDAAALDPVHVAQIEQDEWEREFWRLWWVDPMCSYRQRTGDQRSVIQTADFFPTMRDVRNSPIRRDMVPELTSVMIVPLPAAPGIERRIVFARGEDRAFDERDRQVAALLRPHLQEAWLDARQRRAGVPHLTPREWEILAMTEAGHSHAQIASRLFISITTVRKHMEHIRGKLGVHSAAAAAALAMPYAPTRRSTPKDPQQLTAG